MAVLHRFYCNLRLAAYVQMCLHFMLLHGARLKFLNRVGLLRPILTHIPVFHVAKCLIFLLIKFDVTSLEHLESSIKSYHESVFCFEKECHAIMQVTCRFM